MALARTIGSTRLGASLTLAFLVGGCIGGDTFTSLYLVNATPDVISVSYEHAGVRVLAEGLPPGNSAAIENPFADTGDCAVGDLVAHRLDGTEVARRATKICIGDTWRVESATPHVSDSPP